MTFNTTQGVRSSPIIQRMRRRWMRRNNLVPALLGKGDGNDPSYGAGIGGIWIRREGSTDVNGNAVPSSPEIVNSGCLGDYFVFDGARVYLGLDPGGEWEVNRADTQSAKSSGLDTRVLNAGNPQNKFLRLKNATRLICRPVGTADNPSTVVGVRGLLYDDNFGDFNRFTGTGLLASKLDLSSLIPASGNHAVVCVFLKTFDETLEAYSSTPQGVGTPLDFTDYEECFAQRAAESIPIQAFHLGDGQTFINQTHMGTDLRQFVNVPPALGFPNPVTLNERIRTGRTVTVSGELEITGTLDIDGELHVIGNLPLPGYTSIVEIDNTDSPYSPDDEEIIIADSTSGNITVSLPAISGNEARVITVKNIGTGTVTLDPNASETIDGMTTLDIVIQYDAPKIVATSTEWSIV